LVLAKELFKGFTEWFVGEEYSGWTY